MPCHRRSRIEGPPRLRLQFTLRTIFVLMFVTGVLIVSARWWYVGRDPLPGRISTIHGSFSTRVNDQFCCSSMLRLVVFTGVSSRMRG